MGFNMNGKERLMNGVLKGNLSIVDDVLSEDFYSCDNNSEVLRAAKIKLYEARKVALEAESIVDVIEVGIAANESMANEELVDKGFSTVEESMSMYKLVNSMADGNEKAKKILADILIKSQEKNKSYIFDLNRMGIKGDDIVAVYDFSEKIISKLFYFLDYESDKLISYLAEFNSAGEKE